MKQEADIPRWRRICHCLRRAFINPFSVILFVLAVISFITTVLLPGGYGNKLSTVPVILLMLVISGVVRLIQELKAERIVSSLTRLVHTTVPVKRENGWEEISSEGLELGDLVRLEAGDRVPADIRLTQAGDFFVSQSMITGESAILEKMPQAPDGRLPEAGNRTDTVFMGSTVMGGWAEGRVIALGINTVYGKPSPDSARRKRGFERGANSIAWVLIRFMAVLVPVVFIASGLTKRSWVEAFLFALSVAVGLTPELLPMVINACLARGSALMGQKQTVVKNINAMQGFGSMDILCMDKTGTLTGDQVLLEYYLDILGNESRPVLDYAYLGSWYHTGVRSHLDEAVLRCLNMPGQAEHFRELVGAYPKLDEQPFDYERKYASVLVSGEGLDGQHLMIVKGSVDAVASRCRYVQYRGQRREIDGDILEQVHMVVDDMTEDGMKVLAVAVQPTGADRLTGEEKDFTLLGYLAFFDAPRKSASSAIQKLRRLQVDIRVLTGDERRTTGSVCRRLGIDAQEMLTGEELSALSDNERCVRVERTTVFAELSPRQKAQIVEILQENGHTVGFLGDGMNDLPVEQQADVGISVDTAAEAVKESADVILLKKDLDVLEEGILEGRKAFVNMTKYIRITASSNFGNICAVVAASIFLPFFPMTSVQLLLLGLLYDTLCLILPWDNVDTELLTRPLAWSGRTLGRFMTFFGPLSSLFDVFTFVFLYWVLCPRVCGGAFEGLDAAGQLRFIALFQTGWFLESMWTQVLILLLLRTARLPFVQSRPSAPVASVMAAGILLFTGLTMTPLGRLLGLTSMPAPYYGFLVAVVLLYLLLVTLGKAWYRKRYRSLL